MKIMIRKIPIIIIMIIIIRKAIIIKVIASITTVMKT